jgi:membrane protein DedA with SNARE-associated domain
VTEWVLALVREHEVWAAPIVLVLAFGESLVLVSLLLPATAILFGTGALIGASGIGFWPIWTASCLGALLGDWVSYWLGRHYKSQVQRVWPLSRNPGLVPRAEAFVRTWGIAAVFIGRFFGPLRSVVPFVAGIFAMPAVAFQLANVASAVLWATGILAPGFLAIRWLL